MCLYGVLKYHLMHYLLTGFAKPLSLRVSEKPLIQKAEGSSSFTIESDTLQKAKQDITVVVYGRSCLILKMSLDTEITLKNVWISLYR